MKTTILKSKLTEELKKEMLNLFDRTNSYVSERVNDVVVARKIFVPVEITFNPDKNEIIRVGLVNDLYFLNSKDIDKLNVEFDNEEFNQFNKNGVIDSIIPMNLKNEKTIIAMPAIYIPAENDKEAERFITLEYKHFFS